MNLKKSPFLYLIAICLFLTSCASGYKKINPEMIRYTSRNESNAVILEYKYDVLKRKYRKKEIKNSIKLVSVKITNFTDQDIVFGKNVYLAYENGNAVSLVESKTLYDITKQQPASYLWYLSTVTSVSTINTSMKSASPLGLIIGPTIASVNMIIASSANRNFKIELDSNNLTNKVIKQGETVHGLIGIYNTKSEALKIEFNKN
jgi:hypothetical protein